MLHAEVAERRRAEERAQRAMVEAQVASTAKSTFLSRMSHELRTPLNAILGFGQLLEMRDLGAQGNKDVAHILMAGRRLLQLVDDVLSIATVDDGSVTVALGPVDLAMCVETVQDLTRSQAAARHVDVINAVTSVRGSAGGRAHPG